jgi:hypothetical protein
LTLAVEGAFDISVTPDQKNYITAGRLVSCKVTAADNGFKIQQRYIRLLP